MDDLQPERSIIYVTREQLVQNHACSRHLEKFDSMFPSGKVLVTKELLHYKSNLMLLSMHASLTEGE